MEADSIHIRKGKGVDTSITLMGSIFVCIRRKHVQAATHPAGPCSAFEFTTLKVPQDL